MDCQRRFAARNHGMVEKFDEEIRGLREDIQVRRVGYYGPEGQLRGYAAYRFQSASETNYTQNCLSVEELVYEDGAVLRALLGALKMQEDLAQTVILRTGVYRCIFRQINGIIACCLIFLVRFHHFHHLVYI